MFAKLFVFSFLLLGSTTLSAQTPAPSPKTISGGVLNGKAISLPKPAYPPSAKTAGVGGAVSVQILIDEVGNVVSASAVSGNPLLRAASEEAARAAKFSPTQLKGQPVKVSGVITYNFVPALSNEEKTETVKLSTFLYLVRGSVNNLDQVDQITDSADFIKESIEDFPKLTKELTPLKSVRAATIEKRTEIVDGVIASVHTDLSSANIWQFGLGKNLGDFFSQIFSSVRGDRFDLTVVDEPTLRLNLTKIKDMISSAPSDFPPDVLQKLKELGELSETRPLVSEENILKLFAKVEALINTISPVKNK